MTSNNLSEKMEKMVGRIIVIREICEAKDTLFGPFSEDRTMRMKMKIWTDICEKAKSLGLVAPCKDYRYMRDNYWQNIKRHSLNKRESEANGKKVNKTPIDVLVYEIVDNTSTLHTQPSLRGHQQYILNSIKPAFRQSARLKHDNTNFELVNEDDETADEIDHLKDESPFTQESDEQNETQESDEQKEAQEPEEEDEQAQNELDQAIEEPSDDRPSEDTDFDRIRMKKEEGNMKKRKIQLEIDFLELQNYKTQLEVLDLETKLGIEPSKFTREIVKKKKRNNNIVFEKDEDDDSDI